MTKDRMSKYKPTSLKDIIMPDIKFPYSIGISQDSGFGDGLPQNSSPSKKFFFEQFKDIPTFHEGGFLPRFNLSSDITLDIELRSNHQPPTFEQRHCDHKWDSKQVFEFLTKCEECDVSKRNFTKYKTKLEIMLKSNY